MSLPPGLRNSQGALQVVGVGRGADPTLLPQMQSVPPFDYYTFSESLS